jgi:hypothetical protein
MNKVRNARKALKAVGAGLLLVLIMVGVVYAAVVDIDDFSAGAFSITADDAAPSDSISVPASSSTSIVGGYRDAIVKWKEGTKDDAVALDVDTSTGAQTLGLSVKSECKGRGEIRWDGDNDASNDAFGLGADLESTDPNTGIRLVVLSCDQKADIGFTAYESASAYETLTHTVAADTEHIELFYKYADFDHEGTSGADWSDLGALELHMNGTLDFDTDLTIDFLESTTEIREYGDLPDGESGTPDYDDGDNELAAYHSYPQGLTLGYALDTEDSDNASDDTKGDDDDNVDDEDGVSPVFYYDDLAGKSVWAVDVIVNGCTGTCYLNGWVDFNRDGDFGDSGEHRINDESGDDGGLSTRYALRYADLLTEGYYYLRFRVCDANDECDSTSENATNGEIEDYRWYVDPTAVELSAFDAAWDGDVIEVAWETALEVDTAGFNLWRSTAADGEYVQVNDSLIPSQSPGGTMGASYTFVDQGVVPDSTYYYKLEELEMGGGSSWYGPAETDGGDGGATATTVSGLAAGSAPAWWAGAVLLLLGTGLPPLLRRRRRQRS